MQKYSKTIKNSSPWNCVQFSYIQLVHDFRAESLERHGEVQAMLVELTGVQQSMKEVIQHLEDRLEKVQRHLAWTVRTSSKSFKISHVPTAFQKQKAY